MRLSSGGCCLRTFQDTSTFTYLFFHVFYKIIKNLFTVPENISFAFFYEEEEEVIPPAASSDPAAPPLQSITGEQVLSFWHLFNYLCR